MKCGFCVTQCLSGIKPQSELWNGAYLIIISNLRVINFDYTVMLSSFLLMKSLFRIAFKYFISDQFRRFWADLECNESSIIWEMFTFCLILLVSPFPFLLTVYFKTNRDTTCNSNITIIYLKLLLLNIEIK